MTKGERHDGFDSRRGAPGHRGDPRAPRAAQRRRSGGRAAPAARPTVTERARRAAGAVGKGSEFAGMCEKFTRGHFGFPARYGSAKLAYQASKRDGKVHVDYDAPAGVPVFWDILSGKNAPYDHVAISVGGGYCISTSAGPGGTVAKVSIR